MKRPLASVAAALLMAVQVLLTGLPIGSAGAGPRACPGEMACCASRAACEASAEAACPSHRLTEGLNSVAEGAAVPCVRALGCGHSIPGVTVPSLDPAVFQTGVWVASNPAAARVSTAAAPRSLYFHPKPLAPPPRA